MFAARERGQPVLPILAEEVRRKRRWLLGGVVITLIDITTAKELESRLRKG